MTGGAALKVVVLFLLAVLILAGMRRSSAASRHFVVALALSAGLLVPLLSLVAPAWEVVPRPTLDAVPPPVGAPASWPPAVASMPTVHRTSVETDVSVAPPPLRIETSRVLTPVSLWALAAGLLLLSIVVRVARRRIVDLRPLARSSAPTSKLDPMPSRTRGGASVTSGPTTGSVAEWPRGALDGGKTDAPSRPSSSWPAPSRRSGSRAGTSAWTRASPTRVRPRTRP